MFCFPGPILCALLWGSHTLLLLVLLLLLLLSHHAAFLWTISFGGFGFGLIYDLFRMNGYIDVRVHPLSRLSFSPASPPPLPAASHFFLIVFMITSFPNALTPQEANQTPVFRATREVLLRENAKPRATPRMHKDSKDSQMVSLACSSFALLTARPHPSVCL